MTPEFYVCLTIGFILFILAVSIKPIREIMGFFIVILGAVTCLLGMGILIEVPMILIGGILLSA